MTLLGRSVASDLSIDGFAAPDPLSFDLAAVLVLDVSFGEMHSSRVFSASVLLKAAYRTVHI